jgi:hypothetical protein
MTKQEIEEAGVTIQLTEGNNTNPQEINQLDCSTAHRTLGLQKTPRGNQDKQLEKIREKSNTIAQAIGTLSVTRTEAQLAWTSIYIPATHFQEKDLTTIKNKALTSFLPKMGYNKNTARAVVYGPQECGGIGIKNLYVKQSVEQIKAYMQHTRLESPLGHIVQINRIWVQLIAGIARPLFEDTKTLFHMEGKWYVSIREFPQATDCQIKTLKGWKPQLEREKDQCLMDKLIATTTKNGKKIIRCRLFLQATTIANITTQEETEKLLMERTHKQAKQPTKIKTRMAKTTPTRSEIKVCMESSLTAIPQHQRKIKILRQPLGKWTVTPTKSRQQWNTYYNKNTHAQITTSTAQIIETST